MGYAIDSTVMGPLHFLLHSGAIRRDKSLLPPWQSVLREEHLTVHTTPIHGYLRVSWRDHVRGLLHYNNGPHMRSAHHSAHPADSRDPASYVVCTHLVGTLLSMSYACTVCMISLSPPWHCVQLFSAVLRTLVTFQSSISLYSSRRER